MVSLGTADIRETYTMTITNPDDGAYRITWMNPTTFKREVSEECKANSSSSSLRNNIKDYYKSQGVDIVVALAFYDEAGEMLESSTDAHQYVYTISVDRLISGTTATSMTVSKFGSESDIVLEKT